MKNRTWKKRLTALVLSGLLAFGVMPARPAEAVDAWAAAAQALGVLAAYNSSLASVLAMGNNVNAQMQSRWQDEQQNGLDPNQNDVRVVNSVMTQLVTKGDYALKTNSLPFIWAVNNSKDFNASCYPTDYVSINKGIVRGLNLDPDELAAVLAHEMTHGIEQHSAHNYAKAVAQYYGMSFLNMNVGAMDWNKLNALANYSIAKNVTLPTETEADRGGFFIMTSAGFNPGGGAAAMARMGYYLTYETRDFLEYQDPNADKNQENYNDHPDIDLREQRLAQMMTDYGCGHVTVQNRKDIYIDGVKLMSADWTNDNYDNTAENAYYIAGALAKAFHDYDNISEWKFRDSDGDITCLPQTRVNQVLQNFIVRNHCGAQLEQLVAKAYAGEAVSGAREKLREAELARQKELYARREELVEADPSVVKTMRENGDTYSDYGRGDLALRQMQRVFMAKNPDNMAENYAIRGRAEAVNGNFDAALRDCNTAVEQNPNDVYNFLNRADVYHMMGDLPKALADLQRAKETDATNPFGSYLMAQIYDEQGDKDNALKNYQEFYQLRPKAFRRIPQEYLTQISDKDAKTVQKEKDKAKKELEDKIREEQQYNPGNKAAAKQADTKDKKDIKKPKKQKKTAKSADTKKSASAEQAEQQTAG